MDRSLIARAQEIIAAEGTIQGRDALKRAILERYAGDINALAEALVDSNASGMKDLRRRTYVLPEQPTLFDVPAVIGISTPLGDLYIAAADATAGQVAQWAREGEQWHGGQHRQFKKFAQSFTDLALDLSRNYREQLKELRAEDDK